MILFLCIYLPTLYWRYPKGQNVLSAVKKYITCVLKRELNNMCIAYNLGVRLKQKHNFILTMVQIDSQVY